MISRRHLSKHETNRLPEEVKSEKISLVELLVNTLAMTDALAKLMIPRGVVTDDELKSRANGFE